MYDNTESPSQVVDSKGNLYKFGIEDLGGSYYVSWSTNDLQRTIGKYWYKGNSGSVYTWTNAYGKVITYNSSDGSMTDPNTTYAGTEQSKGKDPTNAEEVPSIDSAYTTATFTRQRSIVPDVFSKPYERFATASDIDKSEQRMTNAIPLMLIENGEIIRKFNEFFTVSHGIAVGVYSNTYAQLDAEQTIKFPVDTSAHGKIEIDFDARLPLNSSGQFTYMKSSVISSVCSFGFRRVMGWDSYPVRPISISNVKTTEYGYDFGNGWKSDTIYHINLLIDKDSGT